MASIEKRINELRNLLRKYDYHYYVHSNPLVSDYDYDKAYNELLDLESKYPEFYDVDSPTQRVGSDLTKTFPTVLHNSPMLSLANTYNEEELLAFDKRIRKELTNEEQKNLRYVAELKIDGISVSLTYIGGKFTRAATRGDGYQGEDITTNVKTIRSVPLKIITENLRTGYPQNFEVRGEIFMDFEGFKNLNEKREKNGEPTFKNTRNSTAGTVKLQDPKLVAERPLDIFVYYLSSADTEFRYHSENLEFIKSAGFKVNPNNKVCDSILEVLNYCKEWEIKRSELSYEIDGVVVKVDNIEYQQKIGSIAKSPRWAVAFKFKAERKATVLNKIVWQVGRTGAVTPVAQLEPILLAGTTVSRATLHNIEEIERKDIREGDTVFVEKGGDVIPKIIEINKELRPSDSVKVTPPKNCPVCGTKLFYPENEVAVYCENSECAAQVKGRLIHFASRGALDIEGLGEAIIDQLVHMKFLKTISDIYTLHEHRNALLNLDRFGEKKVDNLLKAIEDSKNKPFEKVLFGIGIRYVGSGAAAKLVDHFGSIDKLESASSEDIEGVADIGPSISKSIKRFFEDENNTKVILELKAAKLNFSTTKKKLSSNKLDGKSFVITGTLNNLTRESAKQMIIENGGKVLSSVSKKTSYLIAGENAGSKLDKAKKIDINILSEDQFMAMINKKS